VQQKLALPGVVERFMPEANESQLIRECFAGLWTLDLAEDESGEATKERARAIAQPEGYVLKPQREGGGNNYYGAQITQQLNKLSTQEQASFILMERIFPEAQDTVLAKVGVLTHGKGISELGVFGQFIGGGDDTGIVLNEARGHLVRTKLVGVDEGGVATGFSCLDSPFMV
jgi:glutathione synthetase